MALHTRKPPRRHAKQDRSRASVEAVLDAAAQILVKQGYSRATTNRIAEAAGVSVGTLYQYFADKDDVFDALARREFEALVASLPAAPPDPLRSLDADLHGALVAAAKSQRHGPALYRALEQVPGAVFRRRLADARRAVTASLEALLAAHRDELRIDAPALAAFVLVSAIEGIAYNARAEIFGPPLIREITALYRGYLFGAPER